MSATRFLVSRLCCDADAHAGVHDEGCAYRLAWSINPFMESGGVVDFSRAEREHRLLVRTLEEIGAEVVEVPFVHGAYDSVFMKDSAVLVDELAGKQALLGLPRFAERQQEQDRRARSLERLGFRVQQCETRLEGGDVVVLPRGRGALLGWGPRSALESARALARFLDAEVTPIELVDPAFFHLDMCCVVLDDGTCLVCREALHPDSFRALPLVPGIARVVTVPRDEALRFGLNLVEHDGVVICASDAFRVHALLEQRGLTPLPLSLREFQRAGGSAACLVARVHESPMAAQVRGLGAGVQKTT